MKIKERKITRTLTVNRINAKCYNDETDEIKSWYFEIVGDYEEDDVKELSKEHIEKYYDGWTFIKIVENEKREEKREMTELAFYSYSVAISK